MIILLLTRMGVLVIWLAWQLMMAARATWQKRVAHMMERFTKPSYALGLLGLAMAVIPLNDALVKIMSASISLGQVVAVRALLSVSYTHLTLPTNPRV